MYSGRNSHKLQGVSILKMLLLNFLHIKIRIMVEIVEFRKQLCVLGLRLSR
jgi:hypothetical protein